MRKISLVLVSVAALSLLVAGSALGLDRQVSRWLVQPEPIEPVAVRAPMATRAESSPPSPLVDLAVAPSGEDPTSEDAPEAPTDPAGVEVPDLGRVRVDRALEQAEALGLSLHVVDRWGQEIDRYGQRMHRVRPDGLSIEAGTRVEPGTRITARAYYSGGAFADGY